MLSVKIQLKDANGSNSFGQGGGVDPGINEPGLAGEEPIGPGSALPLVVVELLVVAPSVVVSPMPSVLLISFPTAVITSFTVSSIFSSMMFSTFLFVSASDCIFH